ncbi:hypothetical protein M104_4706 [Bacteroides fragilis str. 1007-1-F |uniref:Uncharacterized protein n=1 Tax=Bacteroides fragilis str. 1007-1-F \|nr:hypothetical protein M101_4491 [Bacteroides fragilis str. 1007-1-F \
MEVNRRYQELMQTYGYVTAAKLKDAYLSIGVKQEILLKLFEKHNAEFAKKVGHSRTQGTEHADAIGRFAAIFGNFCPIPTNGRIFC